MVVTEAGIVTVVSLFLANALLPMVRSDEARLKSIPVRPWFSSTPPPDVAAGIEVTDGATVSVLVMTFPAASLVMVIVPMTLPLESFTITISPGLSGVGLSGTVLGFGGETGVGVGLGQD